MTASTHSDRPTGEAPPGSPAPSSTPRLYSDMAWLWPALAPPEDYATEAEALQQALEARRGSDWPARSRVLELGAGGGHNLLHLSRDFDVAAVDHAPDMLKLCSGLVEGVQCQLGDLRSVRLDQVFEGVLLLDAADYLLSEADARAALQTASAHLRPEGVILLGPTYTTETLIDGETAHDEGRSAEHDISYLTYVHDPTPGDSQYELVLAFVLRHRESRRVQVVEDRHQCGVFAEAQWLRWLDAEGFDAQPIEQDKACSLFAGVKRAR